MTDSGLQREKKPSFVKALVFLIVMGVFAAGLAVFVLALRSDSGPQVITAEPEPMLVNTQIVELTDMFALEEKFSGLVTPRRTSALGFQTGGRIAGVNVDIGDRVKQGQTLARLDTRSLQARLASAEAVVEEARAAHALAEASVARQRTLKDKGHISQQVLDEVEAQAETAYARIEAAKAQADTLRVEIDLASIRAPFAGAITSRTADEGAIAAPGAPILELVEAGALEAKIGLPATLAATLTTGETYTLVSDAGAFEATLRATTGVIGASQRTVTTVFDIAQNAAPPAGAVVRIELERDVTEHGAWAPLTALTESSRGLWSVYVVEPSGSGYTAEKQLVEIIHSGDDRVFVRGAIGDGDRIIIDGLQRITPGQPVRFNAGATAAQASEG